MFRFNYIDCVYFPNIDVKCVEINLKWKMTVPTLNNNELYVLFILFILFAIVYRLDRLGNRFLYFTFENYISSTDRGQWPFFIELDTFSCKVLHLF